MSTRVKYVGAAVAVLAVLVAGGIYALSRRAGSPGAADAESAASPVGHWVIAQYAAIELSHTAVGAEFVRAVNNPSSYEILSRHPGHDVLPKATHVEDFDSYQAIREAFLQGTIPAGVQGILYDNERWPGTPLVEQQNPFSYVQQAGALVHRHGLIFINSPAADLNSTLNPAHHGNYSGYLQEKLGALARFADVFDVQAQHAGPVASYVAFAKAAVAQARDANPQAVVLLGITTNGETSQELIAEVDGTRTIAAGYWFNIIGGSRGVSTAVPVLKALGY
jgi:hypothetical protein